MAIFNVITCRYTNVEQDNILVMYETNSPADGVIEGIFEAGSIEHMEIEKKGWDHERIVDATADFKKQQADQIRMIAIESAQEVYQGEIDRKKRELIKAEAYFKQQDSEYRKQIVKHETLIRTKEAEIVRQHAIVKKLEEDSTDKIRKINAYVAASVPSEKMEEAIDNLIPFLSAINESQEAIDYLRTKTDGKGASVLELLKHLM